MLSCLPLSCLVLSYLSFTAIDMLKVVSWSSVFDDVGPGLDVGLGTSFSFDLGLDIGLDIGLS